MRAPLHAVDFQRNAGPQTLPRLTESKFAFEVEPWRIYPHLGWGNTAPSPPRGE